MTFFSRPWGRFSWIMPKIAMLGKWHLIACIASEDRCLSIPNQIINYGQYLSGSYIQVVDPHNIASDEINRLTEINAGKLKGLDPGSSVVKMKLFDSADKIIKLLNSIPPTENVLIDISSFPKRFFFPIIKVILSKAEIKNVCVGYTSGGKYSSHPLASNCEDWQSLPLFGEMGEADGHQYFIAGIGFMPLGLPSNLTTEGEGIDIKLLVPFPPGQPAYRKNWIFIDEILRKFEDKADRTMAIDACDTSGIFDVLCGISNSGRSSVMLAPYGPKPTSLAMCLYSIKYGSPVYYTQPKFYNPHYTTGVGIKMGAADSTAYLVKKNGNSLY